MSKPALWAIFDKNCAENKENNMGKGIYSGNNVVEGLREYANKKHCDDAIASWTHIPDGVMVFHPTTLESALWIKEYIYSKVPQCHYIIILKGFVYDSDNRYLGE